MMGRKPPSEDVGREPDARFSLANERTFLAWNRTALALVAGGIGAAQLLPPFDLPGGRKLLGVPFVALGAAVALVSYRRWMASERAIRLGEPLPPSRLPRLLAVAIAVGAVGAIVLVLFSGRSP